MNHSRDIRSEIRIEAGVGDYDDQSESVSINPNTSHIEDHDSGVHDGGDPEKQSEEGNSELQEDPPNDSTRENATEIYAWGCKRRAHSGDSHGQMGISNKKQNRAYITPKIYSFNISLRQASCGD